MEGINEGTVVLTVEETAKVLRISRNAAYAGVKNGVIPTIRVGRRILIPRPALERLLGLELASGNDPDDEDAANALFNAQRNLWRGRA